MIPSTRFRRIAVFAILFVLCLGAVVAVTSGRRKNVLLITVDSLRADAFVAGLDEVDTPHLDALAADGVLFPSLYAPAPSSLESHAALFTGRMPHELGVDVGRNALRTDTTTMAEFLRTKGYASSGAVAHSDLMPAEEGFGIDRGFKEFHSTPVVEWTAERQTSHLVPLIEELDSSQPFLLFAHFTDPREPYSAHGTQIHKAELLFDSTSIKTVTTSENCFYEGRLRVPNGLHLFEISSRAPFQLREFEIEGGNSELQVSKREEDFERPGTDAVVTIFNDDIETQVVTVRIWMHDAPSLDQARERYRREVEAVDSAVGTLVAELKKRDLYDSTIIAVVGAHGESLGEHGVLGHDVALYGEMLRSPLILKPYAEFEDLKKLRAAKDNPLRMIDVASTLLDVVGYEQPESFTGLTASDPAPREILANTGPPRAPRTLWSIRDARFELLYDATNRRFEMFDLSMDPNELDDVFPVHGPERVEWQERLRELDRESREMRREVGAVR